MDLNNLFAGLTEYVNAAILWRVLLVFIVTDFVTGIYKAYQSEEGISSSKLRDGGFKKMGIVVVVLLSFLLSKLFCDDKFVICNGVMVYYVYTELVSILENLIAVGVPIPPILKKILGNKKTILSELEKLDKQIPRIVEDIIKQSQTEISAEKMEVINRKQELRKQLGGINNENRDK
jgi:toxin secretion/phage lysis holin